MVTPWRVTTTAMVVTPWRGRDLFAPHGDVRHFTFASAVISVFEGHQGPSRRLQLPLLHLHLTNVSPTFTRSSSPSQHGLGVAAGVRGVAQMKEKDFIVR
ncbi:unnamed protein product [Boreogadus saida]